MSISVVGGFKGTREEISVGRDWGVKTVGDQTTGRDMTATYLLQCMIPSKTPTEESESWYENSKQVQRCTSFKQEKVMTHHKVTYLHGVEQIGLWVTTRGPKTYNTCLDGICKHMS